MKIKEVSVGKQFKIGLPSYSNITAQCYITATLDEDDQVNERPKNHIWNNLWDEVNQQVSLQTGDIDPTWMKTQSYKNFFKVTIKQPKKGGDKNEVRQRYTK